MEKQKKKTLIEQYKKHPADTGSPEVQIALLSDRINSLTEHLKTPQEGLQHAQGTSDAGWSTPPPA